MTTTPITIATMNTLLTPFFFFDRIEYFVHTFDSTAETTKTKKENAACVPRSSASLR